MGRMVGELVRVICNALRRREPRRLVVVVANKIIAAHARDIISVRSHVDLGASAVPPLCLACAGG